METSTTNSATLARNFGGAALILAAGAAGDLPSPYSLQVNEYEIEIHLWHRADLVAWAEWIDEPLEDLGTNTSRAKVDLLGFKVQILGPTRDVAVA